MTPNRCSPLKPVRRTHEAQTPLATRKPAKLLSGQPHPAQEPTERIAHAGRHPPLDQVPCTRPQIAYWSREKHPETGKRQLTFKPTEALIERQLMRIPCGQCPGCRIDRSRDWAVRCMHESQMHPQNCFITLTYNNDMLPDDYSVHVRTFQLFMKRLRKQNHQKLIRVFYCGEYGDKDNRPHYHALLFNHDFEDKVFYKRVRGNNYYTSKALSEVWEYGFSTIGELSYASAGYVARYNMKKIFGDQAEKHYTRIHPLTGRITHVEPEFLRMSNRPGIGASWVDKFKSDIFPSDFVIVDGRKYSTPRYYLKLLEEEERLKLKASRKIAARPFKANNTRERLKVREQVLDAKISNLKRSEI